MKRFSIFLTSFAMIAVSACSSNLLVEEFPDTADASQEIQRLKDDLYIALDRQSDVLAPKSFERATAELADAIEMQQEGKDRRKVLHTVAVGRAYLVRTIQATNDAKAAMEEVVMARKAALDADAPTTFAREFRDADFELMKVTSEIENNEYGLVEGNRAGLQRDYLAVELKAIQQRHLGLAKEAIDQAIDEGAKEHAERSLALAQKKVTETEAFIIAHRHQTDAIEERANEANQAADQALRITRLAKNRENKTPEENVLEIEKARNKVQDQASILTQERIRSRELAAQTEAMKADQAFNERFETARSEFKPSEAQVYRQGDQLVIRLRALEFPKNSAELRQSNFKLLGKVANVLKDFDDAEVLVEGHTDSDGSKKANEKLSQERSKAVSEYLISSQAVLPDRISAVGYGFDRPISSNRSQKGKAQNRRVDIVITPKSRTI